MKKMIAGILCLVLGTFIIWLRNKCSKFRCPALGTGFRALRFTSKTAKINSNINMRDVKV